MTENRIVHDYDINLNNRMDKLEEKLNEFKLEVVRSIAELPDKLEGKFAPKWVADVVKVVMGLVAVAIVGSLMAVILK